MGDLTAWVDKVVLCLQEHGWEATRTIEGRSVVGLDVANATGQEDAFERDRQACSTSVGPRPEPEPMSREFAAKNFDDMISAAECLRNLGVATSEPPSKQKYIASLLSKDENAWSPYDDVRDSVPWDLVKSRCPEP